MLSRLHHHVLAFGASTVLALWALTLLIPSPADAIFGCGLNAGCVIGKGVGAVAGGVAGDVVSSVAKAVGQAVGEAVKAVSTLWVKVPTPSLTTTSGAASDSVNYLQTHLYYFSGTLAIAALLVGGAKLAIEQRGEGVRQIVALLLRLAIVTGMGVVAIDLAVAFADALSNWIIDQSTNNTDFGANITGLLSLTTLTGGAIGSMLVVVLGLIAILASVIQVLLMVIRGGMLVMLAGILPTAAAASNFDFGRQWFQKATAWTLAWILYKPAAAIVYATAFRLAGDKVYTAKGLISVITGLSLMILALLALPALMRFVVPAVGGMASGGAGGILAGAGVAAATLPTGATQVAGGGASAAGSAGSNGGDSPSSNGGGFSPSGAGTAAGGGMALAATGAGAAGNGSSANGGSPSSAGALDTASSGVSGDASSGTTAGGGDGGTATGAGSSATGDANGGGSAGGAGVPPAPGGGATGATGGPSARSAGAGGAGALYNAINTTAGETTDDQDNGGPHGSQR